MVSEPSVLITVVDSLSSFVVVCFEDGLRAALNSIFYLEKESQGWSFFTKYFLGFRIYGDLSFCHMITVLYKILSFL